MIERGNIVFVPKGAPVSMSERSEGEGENWHRPVTPMRRDHVAVVDSVFPDPDHGDEQVVCYVVGTNYRYVPVKHARLLDARDHLLTVGRRMVRGGGWGGWPASYMTSGNCHCGARFEKRLSAVEVRQDWRAHVLHVAEEAMARA